LLKGQDVVKMLLHSPDVEIKEDGEGKKFERENHPRFWKLVEKKSVTKMRRKKKEDQRQVSNWDN